MLLETIIITIIVIFLSSKCWFLQEEASMKREPNINPVPRDLTNCGLFQSRDFEQCRQVCVTHDAYNMHKGEFISKSFMIQLDLQYERHNYTNFNIMHISLHNESSNG